MTKTINILFSPSRLLSVPTTARLFASNADLLVSCLLSPSIYSHILAGKEMKLSWRKSSLRIEIWEGATLAWHEDKFISMRPGWYSKWMNMYGKLNEKIVCLVGWKGWLINSAVKLTRWQSNIYRIYKRVPFKGNIIAYKIIRLLYAIL